MLDELPATNMPSWLVAATDPLGDLPIRELLESSVFYPACGIDGDPVKYLGGNFHSFVYVDYGVGRETLGHELHSFRGYRILAARSVTQSEIAPHGWTPRFPPDYTPKRPAPRSWMEPPFATWAVYERLPDFSRTHGPDRFSLLYVGGDGTETFQALYHTNDATPAVVAIIQPGTGFGGNWTDFRDRREILAWTVLDAFPNNRPRFLLNGEKPCWPEFSNRIRELRPGLALYERSDTC